MPGSEGQDRNAPHVAFGEGEAAPLTPIVISVPHAGRAYSPALLAQAQVPEAALRRLEDRHADALVAPLIAAGHQVLIARAPRALIDLNRDPREIDMSMMRDLPHGLPTIASAKLRGGLGLVPRRLQGVGELWREGLSWQDVHGRIEQVHRPYHARLAAMMRRARAAHGLAILLDIHSMPPLTAPATGGAAARIVLGDRFGRSASPRLMALASDLAIGRGIATAGNHPYAGDYLIERHGRPGHGFHAMQVEMDRSLYLDDALAEVGPGLDAAQALLADMAQALARELPDTGFALAAE